MKHLDSYNRFLNEKKPAGAPDWHDSDAPDAEGRFRDLSPKKLAAWLIKTRKKDLKKISGSLTQQVVFNRNEDPEYADKMERTRKEVYKQLGREDLLKEGKMPDKYIGNDDIVYLKTKEYSKGAHYNLYYKGHDIDAGGYKFDSEKELKDFAADYILSNQLYKKLRYEDAKPLPESVNEKVLLIMKDVLSKMVGAGFSYRTNPKMREEIQDAISKAITPILKDYGYAIQEADAKPGPDAYMTGLDKEEEEEKEDQIKKQAKMDDDDPEAYKEMPGDEEAREKGKVKTSKHVKSYHELYGEETDDALSDYEEDDDADYDELYKDYPYKDKKRKKNESVVNERADYKSKKTGPYQVEAVVCYLDPMTRQRKCRSIYFKSKFDAVGFKDNVKGFPKGAAVEAIREGLVTEKAEGARGPIDDSAIESGLKKKSEETGVPIALLRIVMRRGMAAWKSGHRPGATQQQWGYARVNSFLTKQEGTWGGADADVAKEVRDGGHDKKLKKA